MNNFNVTATGLLAGSSVEWRAIENEGTGDLHLKPEFELVARPLRSGSKKAMWSSILQGLCRSSFGKVMKVSNTNFD